MTSRCRHLGILWLAALCFLQLGCKHTPKPLGTTGGAIPLRVWVVLADGEFAGGQSNLGCRLTVPQMNSYVQQLRHNAFIYGTGVIFTWNNNITIVRDDLQFERTRSLEEFEQNPLADGWTSGQLNIYFTGNIQQNGNPEGENYAWTLDPQAALTHSNRAYSLVNDGQMDGNVLPHSWFYFRDLNVLEHEITHFLGRFNPRNNTYIYMGRIYDEGEHVLPPPAEPNNVLKPFAPPAYPLVVPGEYDMAGTERKQIWDRVVSGQWTQP